MRENESKHRNKIIRCFILTYGEEISQFLDLYPKKNYGFFSQKKYVPHFTPSSSTIFQTTIFSALGWDVLDVESKRA